MHEGREGDPLTAAATCFRGGRPERRDMHPNTAARMAGRRSKPICHPGDLRHALRPDERALVAQLLRAHERDAADPQSAQLATMLLRRLRAPEIVR